jgi:hypothetical protein
LNGRADSLFFSSGDEILVAGKVQTGSASGCNVPFSTFPTYTKIWAIDSSVLSGGPKTFYFIDREGKPYNGFEISLKVIRSGRRNIDASLGSVSSLVNPLVKDPGTQQYGITLNTASKVLNASSAEFRQFWKVDEIQKKRTGVTCAYFQPDDCGSGSDTSCTCKCLKKLFDYLIQSRRLFITQGQDVTVSELLADATAAGFPVSSSDCALFSQNSNGLFYALTSDSVTTSYRAKIGKCTVSWTAPTSLNFYHLVSKPCDSLPRVQYYDLSKATEPLVYNVTQSLTYYAISGTTGVDTTTQTLRAGQRVWGVKNSDIFVQSLFKFGYVNSSVIPAGHTLVSADLYLYNSPSGFLPPTYTSPHKVKAQYPGGDYPYYLSTPGDTWNNSSTYTHLRNMSWTSPEVGFPISSTTEDKVFDVTSFVNDWMYGNGNNGIMLRSWPQIPDTIYTTFYSQRTTNFIKHPRLFITYIPDSTIATLQVESCLSCDTIRDTSCKSIVADTTFNPYVTGVLGNWRGDKSYVYYSRRAESDPTTATNIRRDGAYNDFTTFWAFQNGMLKPSYDASRWVWNSVMTLFNNKGAEIENKDPLGRYNSGLYGYNQSLPTAVIQNGQYRESAFEGFEDYGFGAQQCDTACVGTRHIDFSGYKSKLDTVHKHSGTTSLKLTAGQQAALNFTLGTVQQDTTAATLEFSTRTDACASGGNVLNYVRTQKAVLLPRFSPFPGRKMVISAWVKEEQVCNCSSYTGNRIVIAFTGGGGTSVAFTPTGNIIEGWQRYEGVFDIPAGATAMTVSLESTASATVYFDDLRIHPFNANMKSFVYNNVNLRLMAELDENNHTTFYEYDDEGTLIRVKKETERGIKTIKETRSALQKSIQ